jgi:hypothetical protein
MGLFRDCLTAWVDGVRIGSNIGNGIVTGNGHAVGQGLLELAEPPPVSGGDDEKLVERLCKAVGWKIVKRSGNTRVLHFDGQGIVEHRALFVGHGKGGLYLSAISYSEFTKDTMPRGLAAVLLERNDELSIGGWAMNTDDPEIDLTCQYTFPASEVTVDSFRTACLSLVEEAHEFDKSLSERGLL